MQALDVLYDEHRHILRVLDATDHAVAQARAAQSTDPAFFQSLARFIFDYADGAHHAKEEDVLFRALEDFGVPRETGPLHCMVNEHAYGRELRGQLDAAADALAGGNKASLFDVLDASARYAALLRSHIQKEDRALYPMAAQFVPAAAFETMLVRYAEVTKVTAADFARAANALTDWFDPPLPQPTRFTTAAPRVLGR